MILYIFVNLKTAVHLNFYVKENIENFIKIVISRKLKLKLKSDSFKNFKFDLIRKIHG